MDNLEDELREPVHIEDQNNLGNNSIRKIYKNHKNLVNILEINKIYQLTWPNHEHCEFVGLLVDKTTSHAHFKVLMTSEISIQKVGDIRRWLLYEDGSVFEELI